MGLSGTQFSFLLCLPTTSKTEIPLPKCLEPYWFFLSLPPSPRKLNAFQWFPAASNSTGLKYLYHLIPTYYYTFILCNPPPCCRHNAFFHFLKHIMLIGISELLLSLTLLPVMPLLPLLMGMACSLPFSGSLLKHCLLRNALLPHPKRATPTHLFSITASFIVLSTISKHI